MRRRGRILAVILVLMATGAGAEAERIVFSPVDAVEPLQASAVFVSRGPAHAVEVAGELGPMRGERRLRVVLHELEGTRRLLVESLFTGRAGSARVEWRADVWERGLGERSARTAHFRPERFRWLDVDAFEFTDDGPWIVDGALRHATLRTRFTLVEPGVFEVETTEEPRRHYEFGEGFPTADGHADRVYSAGDATFRVVLKGLARYPRVVEFDDPETAVVLDDGPNPYSAPGMPVVVLDACDLRCELLDRFWNPVACCTLQDLAPGPYLLSVGRADVPADLFRVRLWHGERFVGDVPFMGASR